MYIGIYKVEIFCVSVCESILGALKKKMRTKTNEGQCASVLFCSVKN